MKKLLIWLGLLVAWTAPAAITVTPGGGGTDSNTVYNIALVAANAVGGATNGISQATASAMMASGTNTFAGDGLGITNIVNGTVLTNVGSFKRYNVVTYGATGDGSTDDAAAIQDAANVTSATSAAALGQLFFPSGNYLIESGILLNGTAGPTIPGTSFDSGWYKVLGQGSRIVAEGNTNALETANGTRGVDIADVVLVGTNVNRSPVGTHVGFAFNGPQGQMSADNLLASQFTAGFLLEDITGFMGKNLMAISNFVGVAVNFKPDNVNLHVRPTYNYYGVFLNYTNTQFTNYTDAGGPTISGVIGYNTKGIVIPKGNAILRDVYFEGNGISIQLGLEDANTYEATYPGDENIPLGDSPNVSVSGFEGTFQDIYVYRNSTIRFDKTIDFASSKVRLETLQANNSTIESDLPLVVVKSDASELTIGNGYRYVAGAVVPISGMSHTNLTDLTLGDRHSTTNYAVNTNVLIITACETNAFNATWYWNAARYSYTNATVTTHAFTWFAGPSLVLTNAAHATEEDFVFFANPFDMATGEADEWYFPDASTSAMESIFDTRFPVAADDYDDASISTNKMDAVAYAAFIGSSSPGGDSYIFTNAAAGGLRFTNEFGLGAFVTGGTASFLTPTGLVTTVSAGNTAVYGSQYISYAGVNGIDLATGFTLLDGADNPALQPQSRVLNGNWNAQGNLDVDGDLNVDGDIDMAGTFNANNVYITNLIHAFKFITSTNYTIQAGDLIVQGSGTNQIVTLPSAATTDVGKFYVFTLSSTNAHQSMIVTNANGAQTILSATALSQTITNGQSLTIFSDGANWR